MSDPLRLALVLGAALGTLLVLVRGRRLTDRRPPDEVQRKPRRTPVALAGGPAVLVALLVQEMLGGPFLREVAALGPFASGGLAPLGLDLDGLPWLAVLCAFGVGWIDDLRGLGVRGKLAGQVLIGASLAWQGQLDGLPALTVVFLTLVALNAWNGLDHADGMASLPGLVALAPVPGAWMGLAAFVPFNLFLRRGPERVPLAYLGDSGSHLVGLLVLISPFGPWALLVPVGDFARVIWVRWHSGRPIWEGDRRHLGHRLEALGLGPTRAAFAACSGGLAILLALAGPDPFWLLAGAFVPLMIFAGTVRCTADPGPPVA